jgi:translation initiation factor IF-2
MAAAGLESLVYEKKSEEKDEEAKPNPPKKPKLDLTKFRPAWVLGSVAEAVRSDAPPATGRGRGGTAPRGGNRGGQLRGSGRGHSGPPRSGWVPRGGGPRGGGMRGGGMRGRGPYRGRGRGRPF